MFRTMKRLASYSVREAARNIVMEEATVVDELLEQLRNGFDNGDTWFRSMLIQLDFREFGPVDSVFLVYYEATGFGRVTEFAVGRVSETPLSTIRAHLA